MAFNPPHALVIGGSGMLRGVCLHLANGGRVVSVLARNAERLQQLSRAGGGRVRGISVDYRDFESFEARLRDSVARDGPIDLAAAWIHSDAPHAPVVTARVIADASHPPRFFQILGSASADPSILAQQDCRLETITGIRRRKIILGFVIEQDISRWLTNDEIARGVIDAIDSDREETVVGVVRPWSRRP